MLLGLLFFTSYYPAWFFVFTLLVFALVVFVASFSGRGTAATMTNDLGICIFAPVAAIDLPCCPALVPAAFRPDLRPVVMSNSKRSFDLVLQFTPRPKDIINVSAQNLVWSPLLRRLGFKFGDREVQMGSPLILLGLFLLFLVRQVTSQIRRVSPAASSRTRLLLWLSTTAVVIFALIIQVRGISLWYAVYSRRAWSFGTQGPWSIPDHH